MMLLVCASLNAQRIDIKEKVKNKAIDRADQRTDQAIDKGMDEAEEGVVKIFKKEGEEEEAEENNEETENESDANEDEEKVSPSKAPQKTVEPKLQSYTKYDFIPGDEVILFEDFSQDAVGDFPALWTTSGSGEVRNINNYPGKWFFMNSEGNVYNLMQDLSLPDNFILEFDLIPTTIEDGSDHSGAYLTLYQGEGEYLNDELYPGMGGVHVDFTDISWRVSGYNEGAEQTMDGETELATIDVNKSNHVIVWIQKRRLRIYHKGQKALDLPTVMYPQVRYNRLRFSLWGHEGFPYITNLRITTAAPDMRSKLLTEGRLVSYGIYFDVNKDVVKPESNGTLKEIAAVLTENPDVRIKIVGHTDSDGADAANLDLSKRRSVAVKNELVKSFAIDASRIETDGKGETVPVAANDVPANKAMNRRVEFIKL
jgi:outer membrane protein OmpA-like peptidoglycan-associated protein